MNKSHADTQVIRENNATRSARRVRAVAVHDSRKPITTVVDWQIAEIERTFTARYEW